MKLANGTVTLTSGSLTMKFVVSGGGNTGTAIFDTFTYDSSLDCYTADHAAVVIVFNDATHFSASTGVAPNQHGWSGTYS